jgi:hypothetical protein
VNSVWTANQNADDGGFYGSDAGVRSGGHHVADPTEARDACRHDDRVGDPPGRILSRHPAAGLLSVHSTQDELSPRDIDSGGGDPAGKRESPTDRVAHRESDSHAERHGD